MSTDPLFSGDETSERDSAPRETVNDPSTPSALPIDLSRRRSALIALAAGLLYLVVAPLLTLAVDLALGTSLTPTFPIHYATAAAIAGAVFLALELAVYAGGFR